MTKGEKYRENDILKSRILKTEEYMDLRAKEIVDFVEGKELKEVTPKGEIFDRLVNRLVNEFPFGPEDGKPYFDKVHIILATALTSSLWCGWLSKAMVNRKEPKFKEEYVQQFGRLIPKAFDIGRKYASRRP